MADLSITAGNVIAGASAVKKSGISGATITAGRVVYLDPSDSRYKIADADSVPSGGFGQVFLALNGASNGQPITVMSGGPVVIGATVTAGTAYYLSPTPGGIAPLADILSGDSVVLIGAATSATTLQFKPLITGVTL